MIRPLIETPPPGPARRAGRRGPGLGRGRDQPRSEVPPQSHPARTAPAAGGLLRDRRRSRARAGGAAGARDGGRARSHGDATRSSAWPASEAGALTLPRGGARARCRRRWRPRSCARPPPASAAAPRSARGRTAGLRARAGAPSRRAARFVSAASTVEVSGDRVRVGARPSAVADVADARRAGSSSSCRRSAATLEARDPARDGLRGAARGGLRGVRRRASAARAPRARRAGAAIASRRSAAASAALKSLLIDAKVPRWERARAAGAGSRTARILWVAGLRRGAAAPTHARHA